MNVNVMTTRFGAIEIDDDRIIEMPDGMLGFAERRFILLSPDNNGSFSGSSPWTTRHWPLL